MGIYLLVFLLTRISALGSLVAVLTYPFWVILVFRTDYLALRIFSLAVVLLVLITHRSNILRLLHGQEKSLFRKKGD
jgi:glycerol-3-phosphate acyltransferase PlsY